MEYLVVTLAIGVVMVVVWHTQIYDSIAGEYVGQFGLGLKAMFQWVLGHITLPIP